MSLVTRPFAITPAEVAVALRATGRNISERTLRAWRDKGLLPPLKKKSRGRGKGVDRYWSSPNIVLRASVAHDLLQRLNLYDDALFNLAAAGFLTGPETLRTAWQARLARRDRLIDAQGRRRKDGVEGLVPAQPRLDEKDIDKAGLAQAFLELHRVYVTGEPVEQSEIYALVHAAASSFDLNRFIDDEAAEPEIIFMMLESLFDREFERNLITDATRSELLAAQIALNCFYRILENLTQKLGLGRRHEPFGIILHSLSLGFVMLKLALIAAQIIGPSRLVLGIRPFERWSTRAQVTFANGNKLAPHLTNRSLADLRRTFRKVFAN